MNKRLPTISGMELIRILRKRGWSVCHVRGSHHQLLHGTSGKRITVPVHAGRDLKRGLLMAILKDIGMTQKEFQSLL